MANNTTNLNLLKKDPVVDANDTFNIETMLNENWDKIDQADGENVKKATGKGLSTEDYTTTEKSKLAGIEDNANNYTHPTTHNASIINTDSTHRFVTDAEKAAWNAAEQNAKNYVDSKKDLTGLTLLVANWVDDTATTGKYYYEFTDATVTSNIIIHVNWYFPLNDDNATKDALIDMEEYSIESYDGYWRIYANNLATQDFIIDNIEKR